MSELQLGGVPASTLVSTYGSPLFVYDESLIRQRARELREAISHDPVRFLYACKANTNLSVLKVLCEEGVSIDAVSPWEIKACLEAGFTVDRITFTGNNVTNDELKEVVEMGVLVNADSLSLLARYGELFPGTEVAVRINPDVGGGHHDHCITGGPDSKFGIYHNKLGEIQAVAGKYNLRIKGVMQHIGSGILDTETFLTAMEVLLKVAKDMPDLDFVDFGGGIGVPYKPDETHLDLAGFGKKVSERFAVFCKEYGKNLELRMEPGRFYVCEAGTLLATVNTVKATDAHTFVGTDTGFNQLIRPAMYGSYHEIQNATDDSRPVKPQSICGNVCESGDMFGSDRELPELHEGDILALRNAGAYGMAMASNYNMRALPAEVMVKDGAHRLIRRREHLDDLLRTQREI